MVIMPDASPSPVRRREDLDPRPRSRDRSWPSIPEPLPLPVIDNHCHLDFADGDLTGLAQLGAGECVPEL